MDHNALHCMHVMALEDKVDCLKLSDMPCSVDLESETLLPNQ